MQKSLAVLLFFLSFGQVMGQTTFISAGSSWSYNDTGIDQGTAWYSPSFDDSGWSQGNAELGYDEGDENTVISYGPSSSNKYPTYYFRSNFSVSNPASFSFLELSLVCDDGCVVYLNGLEVYRQNMPSGAINYNSLASSNIIWPNENDWTSANISSSLLVNGVNSIAIEVHQHDLSSSDISFNCELTGETAALAANVVRGPYLQTANDNQIYVCWRSDIATDSKINFGENISNLNQTVIDPQFTTDHFVKIAGLNPKTKYYYEFGSNGQTSATTSSNYFKTHPQIGEEDKYRFWVIGDAGMANGDQDAVTTAFDAYNNQEHLDGWIMLGDNAYQSGFDSEYQGGVFDAYPQFLPNTVLWPSPGNHDYNNHIPFSPPPAYYEIFELPTNAEAGGYPSGTEKYYSWNLGNVHFISLDSYDEGRNTSDPMAQWLTTDLANNTLPWIVAYWHHPPYTKGSHDSDNWLLDGELIDMRENILPILETGGVDLVLNGHSHCYERSNLIDSHYGESSTFTPGVHLKDGGSGDYINDCPYIKNTDNGKENLGTIAAVVGCSGKLSGTSSGWPHPIMESYTNSTLGSMLIEVEGQRMDCKFITSAGTVFDQFSIVKDVGGSSTIQVCAGEQLDLSASWNGMANWFPNGIYTDTLTVIPQFQTTYFAEDDLGCITDTINIEILDPILCGAVLSENEIGGIFLMNKSLTMGDEIQINFPVDYQNSVIDIHFSSISGQYLGKHEIAINPGVNKITSELITSPGTFILSIQTKNEESIRHLKFNIK